VPTVEFSGEERSGARVAARVACLTSCHRRWSGHRKRRASDPRSTKSTAEKRKGKGETFGGVDYYGHTKDELYERAKELDIDGRSKMDKKELARAIAKHQWRAARSLRRAGAADARLPTSPAIVIECR